MRQVNDYLSYTLADFYHYRPYDGHIGVEFEVEGKNIQAFNTKNWVSKPDGSLRNGGIEWVTRGAIDVKRIPEAIQEWFINTKLLHFSFDKSVRTSIHIHVNAQRYNLLQLYTIITAYWLIENILCSYSGPSRCGNLFCLRVKDADYSVNSLCRGLEDLTFFNAVSSNDFKYAALNLQALTKYGSFEFRMMRGEYSDPEFITQWIMELYNLVHNASKIDNPKHVVLSFKHLNPVDFLKQFFSENFVKELVTLFPNFYTLMEENFHYAFNLATTIDDWSLSKNPAAKPTSPKKKKMYVEPAPEEDFTNEDLINSISAFPQPTTTITTHTPFLVNPIQSLVSSVSTTNNSEDF